jgi:SAM-dependent methyltransferase
MMRAGMQISRHAAVAVLRRRLSGRPLAVRAHVWGRFHSCPFLRTLHHIEPGARVLDVGAGHGLFAVLALEAGAAGVTAVEPDLRKPFSALRDDRVRFVTGYADVVAFPFDLITMFDVLYRVPIVERDRLLATLRDRLRPGGVLLIKELDPEHRLKSAWNHAQEWISDRFLGITLGSGLHYETKAEVLRRLENAGFAGGAVEDIGRGYPHAHIAYLARRVD